MPPHHDNVQLIGHAFNVEIPSLMSNHHEDLHSRTPADHQRPPYISETSTLTLDSHLILVPKHHKARLISQQFQRHARLPHSNWTWTVI
jgi:hypothetical protein